MSLLYNKLIESIKTAIYKSLFDDIDDIVTTDNDNVSTIIDKLGGNYNCVDLGLPSGTLWCDKNLGAEDETDPYRNNIKAYAQSLYFLSDMKYESKLPHIILEPRFYVFTIRPVFNS